MTGENTLWLTGERLSAIHSYETLCQLILGSLGLCCPFTAGVQVGSKAIDYTLSRAGSEGLLAKGT
jgi:hypothetical protein